MNWMMTNICMENIYQVNHILAACQSPSCLYTTLNVHAIHVYLFVSIKVSLPCVMCELCSKSSIIKGIIDLPSAWQTWNKIENWTKSNRTTYFSFYSAYPTTEEAPLLWNISTPFVFIISNDNQVIENEILIDAPWVPFSKRCNISRFVLFCSQLDYST